MNHFEKESLGLFPTPMYRLPNISRELGTNVWIKRDDLCGVALGGNKVRKLEYLLHDAKTKGYDLVMTLAHCGGNFYDGWMRNPKSAMISCNDGFRPVSFYIEALDEEADA